MTTDVDGIAVADPLPTPPVITSPAPAAEPLPVSLAIGSALDGASIAARKTGASDNADSLPAHRWITSPAPATTPSLVPLAFGSVLDGPSIAAQKTELFNDAEAPGRGPVKAELQAAAAWFTSLGSDSAWSSSGHAGVSHRPSSELTPALVDAVFHPAANNHEKLTGVGDEFPDALV